MSSMIHQRLMMLLAVTATLAATVLVGFAQSPQMDQGEVLFHAAEADWHDLKYDDAIAKYKQVVAQFPKSPKATEAQCHYAFCLAFVAPPDVAIPEYEKVIKMEPKSQEAQEAKTGIAALKYWLGDLQESYDLFRQVRNETTDWVMNKECTSRMKQIARQIQLEKNQVGLAAKDCGPKALLDMCRIRGIKITDNEAAKLLPIGKTGVSMEQLRAAAQSKGLKLTGAQLEGAQLETIQKPFIAHLRNNHFLVVTAVKGSRIDFIDADGRETYTTTNRFHVLWDGASLISDKKLTTKPGSHSQLLTKAKMKTIMGGHHLHGTNLGDSSGSPASFFLPDQNGCTTCTCDVGLPHWSINMANYNLLVQDTDFHYSGRGPSVGVTRTYNADSSQVGIFGRCWTSTYEVSLSENPDGVDVKRESGKTDHFIARGDGTYTPPLWIYDELTKMTNNSVVTYALKIKNTKLTQNFNSQGQLVSIADRNGNAVTILYDASSRLQVVMDAVGRGTQFTYNPSGQVSQITDPLGRTATFTYDANNNLTGYVDMVGNAVSYTYDSLSYLTSFTTPKGTTQIQYGTTPNFTEFPYLVKQITDPLGNTITFDTGPTIAWYFDARGNQYFIFNDVSAETIQFTDPLGHITTRGFTSGNLTSVTDAAGRTIAVTYDANGNMTGISDSLGNRVQLSYDGDNNLTNVIDALGRSTRCAYDAHDNSTQIRDAKGSLISFAYDGFGELTALTNPRTNVTRFSYDNQGNVASMTNPLGGTTSCTYDFVGRVLSLTTPKTNTFRYIYDGNNRLLDIQFPDGSHRHYNYDCCVLDTITDSSGSLAYQYDADKRLIRFTNSFHQVIQYGYDANRNLTTLSYPDGKMVQYAYDSANRLTKVTDWLGNSTMYSYDASGLLVMRTNSNGTVARYQYDAAARLTTLINAKADGWVIAAYRYGLDASGDRTNIATVGTVPFGTVSTNVASTFDADNRILASGGKNIVHDADGNLVSIGGSSATTFTYDTLDRLAQVTFTNYNFQVQYDPQGNRNIRTVNGKATKFVTDPNAPLARVLAETDNGGNITAYYVFGLGLISKVIPTGQAYFYHYDGIASTVALSDINGNVLNKYAYDPFGNLSSYSVESIPNSFRYVGGLGVSDEGNGLLYMRARYYAPSIGRFVNHDPIGNRGGLNLYAYVHNNPLRYTDPLGLCDTCPCSGGNNDNENSPPPPPSNPTITIPPPGDYIQNNPFPYGYQDISWYLEMYQDLYSSFNDPNIPIWLREQEEFREAW